MKLDYYAVLGLSPTAEDAVIRAAYLALMRSYHPDRNASPEAAARARAITEAYETIGDPARRAEYNDRRKSQLFEFLEYDEGADPAPRQWRKAPVVGMVAASALAIVLAVMALPLTQSGRTDPAPGRTTQPPVEKPVATEEVAATSPTTEEKRPSERVASVEASRPPAPPAAPAIEIALARRSEPAPDIAGKAVPAKADAPTKPKRTAAVSPKPGSPNPAQVDEQARIATLEGMSTSFYNQSVQHADAARRSQLQQARASFVNTRSACRSDKCVGDAHASYVHDISRIMQKPGQTIP